MALASWGQLPTEPARDERWLSDRAAALPSVDGSLLGLLTAIFFIACLLQLAGSVGFGVAPGAGGLLFLADAAQVFVLFGACRRAGGLVSA